MVKKYGSKRDKAVATKGWAAREGQSVQETKRMMDVELFLEGQTKWEEDSPHQLVMLYQMFKHATDEGQKEAEQIVCRRLLAGVAKAGSGGGLICLSACQPQNY